MDKLRELIREWLGIKKEHTRVLELFQMQVEANGENADNLVKLNAKVDRLDARWTTAAIQPDLGKHVTPLGKVPAKRTAKK